MKGQFGTNGTYMITDDSMKTPWEYIYQNGDVMLRVDQNGPVNAQLNPPQDIMLFKRELSDKFSKWITFVTVDGHIYTSFAHPSIGNIGYKPKVKITFAPHCAEYEYAYKELMIKTQIFIPSQGAQIVMRTDIKNISSKKKSYTITPAMYPYINNALLAPWDKYEWYLRTSYSSNRDYSVFCTTLYNPGGTKDGRRAAALYLNSGTEGSAEIAYEEFTGAGDFLHPHAIQGSGLRLKAIQEGKFGKLEEYNSISGYPPVYARQYNVEIKAGESWSFSQVMTELKLNEEGELYPELMYDYAYRLLSRAEQDNELNRSQQFFQSLFQKNTVKTSNSEFDNFVNSFLPLQMHWVAALDRGWPTGMRGVRDASNDFMGLLMLDKTQPREVIKQLFCCQRSDGWLPRQISTSGRHGKHDLREYVDGGVFACELIYEYLCYTKDFEVLNESMPYLDKDEEASLAQHFVEAVDYYIRDENIGEHGLCKIRGGDWLDAVNYAGIKGRGESVMVTCQTIMTLKYASQILKLENIKELIPCWKALLNKYDMTAKTLMQSLESAFNDSGFYNSVFNDGGEWVFSANDADGANRLYGPANYYAIISGAASGERAKNILKLCLDRLKSDMGYKLFVPAFGSKAVPHTGRIASGDMPEGLWENGNVYNHGSQGFLLRALSVADMGEEVYDVLQYMMPYDQSRHPVELTKSAPYAVLNCYQDLPLNRHRGGMPFLTGTIAMIMRGVYNWMFGIRPVLDGLLIVPCVPKELGNAEISYDYNGCKIQIRYNKGNNHSVTVTLNEKPIDCPRADIVTDKVGVFVADELLLDGSVLVVSL